MSIIGKTTQASNTPAPSSSKIKSKKKPKYDVTPPKLAKHSPRFHQTLSWRLVLAFLSLLATVLAGIILLVVVSVRSYLMHEVDTSLTSSGKVLATQTVDQIINNSSQQVLPSDFYFYVDLYTSQPVSVINQQVGQHYGIPKNPELLAQNLNSQPQTIAGTKSDIKWRTITVELQSQLTKQTIGRIVIAHHLASVEATVSNVKNALVGLVLIIIGIGGVVAYILVHLSLRRLRYIEQVTHTVAGGDLSVRVPDIGPEGTEIGMLGKSINEMLKTIENLFQAKQDSERHMRRFVSDASHELRTPLATVRGYAELYRLGGIPTEQIPHAFDRIESEASRMTMLVEDLLQLARLDEGRQLEYTQVELASTAMNAVADFLVRAPERNAQVIPLTGNELLPVVISADQNRIAQVLANLLGNVITHTPAGTGIEIAIGIDPHNPETAIVEVRDHGKGISEENRERIFERFFRTDASRSRNSGGTGLGLAIVAAICSAHGGSAEVDETLGGGLTVRMRFPSVLTRATNKARQIAVSSGHIASKLPDDVKATILSANYEIGEKQD